MMPRVWLPLAVHGQRVADDRLDGEPVQHGAEHRVVVEPGRQPLVPLGLGGLLAVDHALVQVGGPQVPDPAGELDVVAVVHLGQVIERPRPLGEQHPVGPAVVLQVQPALLDVDVRRAVLAHRAQLDQVDVGVGLGDREQHVQVPDHVVLLGVHRVRPVDHRVRRGPLLGEVDHGLGLEVPDDVVGEQRVGQVTDVHADLLAGQLLPHRDPRLQRLDRHQGLDPELVVVVPADEVVGDRHLMAGLRQVQRCRPAQIPVPAQHQDFHAPVLPSPLSVCRLA